MATEVNIDIESQYEEIYGTHIIYLSTSSSYLLNFHNL